LENFILILKIIFYYFKILFIILTINPYHFLTPFYLSLYQSIKNLEIKIQIYRIKKYYDLCNKGILINKKIFKISKNPKISIVSTVYNNEKFIQRFLRSIQNQFFDDIEIILIDDHSKDNSVKIINDCQKEDKRILLIKQKFNKGTLISRNIGVLKSKGDYIIIPDSDDILSNDILKKSYITAKRKKCELIRFNFYFKNHIDINNKIFNIHNNPIYKPKLNNFIFYGFGYLRLHDFNICNKFIKRELFIRTLNNINIFYLNQYMIYFEDGFINYALNRNANSLYLLNNLGYFYINNKQSSTNTVNKNLELKCFLLYLKYIFDNSKNNPYEKKIPLYFLKMYINNQNNQTKYLKYLNNYLEKYKIKIFY